MKTVIHLVRHAEVHNPDRIWYGRLPGFGISERGKRQAKALADHFSEVDLQAIYASPLQRAQETAAQIAAPHGIDVVDEPQIIESKTKLQGKPGSLRLLLNPLNFRFFVNPLAPSWGESYKSITSRMWAAVQDMREHHSGRNVVAVSHMTPIIVARLRAENSKTPAWRAGFRCGTASVTTLVFGDSAVDVSYVDVGSSIT